MKINIVTEKEGWILYRIAESYARRIKGAVVGYEPDPEADINFYVNYGHFRQKTKIDVGYFTHKERDKELASRFDEVASKVDWCIAMNDKTAKLLPPEKTTIVQVAPDEQFMKGPIVFGVVAREYSSSRKRTEWIRELEKIDGIEIKFTNGAYSWEDMPNFYKSIDYLLILSDNEGGPVPLLEALAMGVPVISSDVGFVSEHTTIRYFSLDNLKDIIKKLLIPKNSWEISAKKIEDLFLDIYNQKSKI